MKMKERSIALTVVTLRKKNLLTPVPISFLSTPSIVLLVLLDSSM